MAKLKRIYEYLQALGDASVDRAIAQALPTADPATLGPMALILLQRRQTDGGLAIVENYHRLPPAIRHTVLQHAPELTKPLRIAIGNHKSAGPANAIHIIRRSASVRLAYLIADQLRHGQDELKDESAHCLLEMAQRTTSDADGQQAPAGEAMEVAFVSSAVQEAIKFYAQHQRKDVLLAMFSLPLPSVTKLLASVGGMGTTWTHPVGVLLTRSDTPAIRRALLAALSVQALHPFAVDGIGLALDTGHITHAVSHWHLLLLKRYRNPIKRIKNAERFVPGKDHYQQTDKQPNPPGDSPGHTHGLAAWIAELPMEPPTLIRHLGALSAAADPATRLAALRRLLTLAETQTAQSQAHHAIAGFCTDKKPELVRIAATHLIRCGYPDITKVLAHLINSPDPGVQKIAGKRLVPVAFPRLWESWPRLNRAQRLAAGRALIKIDPGFHAALHDKLATLDSANKLRALSIIGELNQGLLLQDTLFRLCRDSDPKVVSAAVKALGSADPARALPVIEAALEHEDDRVRANAVEALAQLDAGRHADVLASMTTEREANRARANAIQALMQMRTGEALTALSRMLGDPRAEHRASALWLVETMGVAGVAREVAEMSISEPDPKVRKKAAAVIQAVIQNMSQPLAIHGLFDDDVIATPDDQPKHADRVAG